MNKKIVGLLVSLFVIVILAWVYALATRTDSANQDESTRQNSADATPSESGSEQQGTKAQPDETQSSRTQQLRNDTLRRESLSKLSVMIAEFSADNNGKPPSIVDLQAMADGNYKYDELVDPSTNRVYTIVLRDPAMGEIEYTTGTQCTANNETTTERTSSRSYTLRTLFESSGLFCVDG